MRPSETEPDWLRDPGLDRMLAFLETKTVWHPIGVMSCVKTTVVDHPLAAEQLTVLRDETTDRATFRRAVDNLAAMLIYEATRDLAVETTAVRTPLGPAEGVRLPRLPVAGPGAAGGARHGRRRDPLAPRGRDELRRPGS